MLLDIPRLRGVPWLEPGEHVFREDLEAAAREQGVEIGEGDILLVRTGHARRLAELGPWDTASSKAGLHPTAMPLLAERGVAALGCDGNSDTAPSTTEGVAFPIHVLALNAMGVLLLDYLQFEDLRPRVRGGGALGVPVRDRPAAHHRRHGLARQPTRDPLIAGMNDQQNALSESTMATTSSRRATVATSSRSSRRRSSPARACSAARCAIAARSCSRRTPASPPTPRRGKTMGIPLLYPWANRLAAFDYSVAGEDGAGTARSQHGSRSTTTACRSTV